MWGGDRDVDQMQALGVRGRPRNAVAQLTAPVRRAGVEHGQLEVPAIQLEAAQGRGQAARCEQREQSRKVLDGWPDRRGAAAAAAAAEAHLMSRSSKPRPSRHSATTPSSCRVRCTSGSAGGGHDWRRGPQAAAARGAQAALPQEGARAMAGGP